MGSEWVQTTIGDFLEQHGGEIKTGPFGTKLKASEYSEVGVPVISVGEVQLGRLTLHERTPKVDVDVIARMPEYLLKTGDIVFGRKGAVERSARVRNEEEGWFLGSDGIRLRLPECCDSRFIAYSFLTEAHKQWMVQHAAGTTMASLNEKIIRLIPLSLPPLPVQKAIADHLEIIDNKIALNRQINTTLESMAQALFKSWFVDFDPVIDNALAAGNEIPDALAARAARREALRQQTNETSNKTTGATDADSSEQALTLVYQTSACRLRYNNASLTGLYSPKKWAGCRRGGASSHWIESLTIKMAWLCKSSGLRMKAIFCQ